MLVCLVKNLGVLWQGTWGLMQSDFQPQRSTAEAECKGEVLPLDGLLAPCSLLPCLLLDGSLLHLLMPPYRNLLKWNATLIINFLLDHLSWVILFDLSRRKKPNLTPTQNIKWHKTQLLSAETKLHFSCASAATQRDGKEKALIFTSCWARN